MSRTRLLSLRYGKRPYCRIPLAGGPARGAARGLSAVISLREAGNMAFDRRESFPERGRLLVALGVSADRAYGLRQVHSRVVVAIDELRPEELADREADGMISARPEAVLTVTVADCLPIFLVDPVGGGFCLVHSGWRGTGIAAEAVREMARLLGARPARLQVTIGPGIGACCYTVSEQRARLFAARFGEGSVRPGLDGGKPRLDLRRANEELLRRAGVREIAVVSDCTCCSAALGSFRRQGQGYTPMLAALGRFGAC
jgi:YfiH family protein